MRLHASSLLLPSPLTVEPGPVTEYGAKRVTVTSPPRLRSPGTGKEILMPLLTSRSRSSG